MNAEFCPNKASKEFKEMKDVFGEDTAYFLWMRNGGNHLEKAPNGADSKLFNTLLDYYKGNRTEALRAKAKTYKNEFIRWFGDWTGNYSPNIKSIKEVAQEAFDERGAYDLEINHLRELIEKNAENITFEQAKLIYDAIRRIAVNDGKVPGTSSSDKTKIVREAFKDQLKEKTYFAIDTAEDIQFDLPSDEADAKIELYKLKKQYPELNLKLESFENIDKEYFDILDEFIQIVKPSEMFQSIYDLVDYTKNAVNKSINQYKEVSKAVDENGEPLIENLGMFNQNDSNIYHHIDIQTVLNNLLSIANNGLGYKVVDIYNKLHGTNIKLYKDSSGYHISPSTKPTFSGTDSIRRSYSAQKIYNIINHLNSIFGNKFNIQFLNNEDYHKLYRRDYSNVDLKSGAVTFPNEDGTFDVFINSQYASDENVAEELLHPFVYTIKEQNPDLFKQLIDFATENFSKLKNEINTLYTSKQDEELVCQVLSRYFAGRFQKSKLNKFKDIINKFWNIIIDWFNSFKQVGDKYNISLRDITKMKSTKDKSFKDLAELLNTADVLISLKKIEDASPYYHIDTDTVDSIKIEDDINTRRTEYVNNVVSNWKNGSKLEGAELSKALLKVKDNARKQFDLDEITKLRNSNISNENKKIILNLLYRDLEIVSGLQHVEAEQKDYDKETFDAIKEGTKTRLRSHLNRSVKQTRLINDLKEQIAQLENVSLDDVDEMFKQIELFLNNAEQEILKTRVFIDEQLIGKDISTWNPQQINYIRYDLLGYYDGILTSIYQLFTNNSKIAELNKQRSRRALEMLSLSDEERNNLSQEDKDIMYSRDLFDLTSRLQRVVDSMQQDYQDKVAIPYAKKILMDFVYDSDAVKDKEAFIRNMIKWIEQDTIYGDLAAGEIALGMASRSRSPIINIIEKVISDIEFEKNRQILKTGNELIRLYNKVRPAGSQVDFRNFQKLFMEMDGEDGTTGKYTGYFVRDRNYGKFYKDKDAFEQSLRDKYAKKGLKWKYNEYNNSVELIFPEEDHTADNSIYNQYYDELDEWLDEHCERRYKLEYYKKKRRFLSPKALQAQQLIQRQIDILSQKAMTEDGFVDTSKLTSVERQRLADLRKQKRELACPYIFDTLSDGTVTLKEKTGEDAEIAQQISRWNKFVSDHVKYKQNEQKFNEALSKFEKGSPEYKRFLADNRIQIINPEFWKIILEGKEEQTQEYKDLQERYRVIVNHIKNRQGYVTPNLDLLGVGINTDTSAWEELHRIEQRMEEIKIKSEKSEESKDTKQFVTSFLVNSTKQQDKAFLDWIKERWQYEISQDESAAEVFKNLFTITDNKGRQRFLKIFGFTSPSSFSIKDKNGKSISTLVYQYSSQFSELEESSDFVNDKYKKDLKVSMQPKVRKAGTQRKPGQIDYTNDNYNKIIQNDGYKQLYDKLISLMESANGMIPQGAIERRFLLPQITGRGMSILGRSRSSADLFASLNYGLQDWTGIKIENGKAEFDESLMQQDADVSTNWDLPRRPDGSVVNNIPIRFVKRLEDPSIISSDVIGSVLLYYDMALNYKLKSEKLPSLELIQEAINPNTKVKQSSKNKLPKQYEKMKNLMDYRVYGKESRLGSDDTKSYSKFQKSAMQISKKFKSLASMSMLALNFTTIEVGYLDALLGSIADAVGGKYFTVEDLNKGYWDAFKSLFNIIPNLGNPVVDDWMVAAMQYNQLSKSNSDIFGRTDQSRWNRLLSELRMGGYTMADYLINTMILGATYNHYRLLDMPDGKTKKFMSKSDAIDIYTKHGYTEDEAISKWNSGKTTLKQAYYQEDGFLKIKDEFKQYVTKKLENQIAGRLRDRTSVYNGIIPQTEKATLQQNVFGSFLTLMRNFYVNTYWERARAGYDYATEEELQSSKLGMYTADSAGSVNFETGEFGNGLWFSALKGFYKYITNVKALVTGKDLRQLTRDQKYAVNRILTEVAMIGACAFLMLWSIAFARTNDYDDDKDPMWTVNVFDPEGKDRGILQFNGKNAGDKMLNWTRWKLALLATRLFTERSTFYWPGTITELISSPSTAKSYLDDLGYTLELFMDLFEINGHDRNELVRSGGYKGMTRGTRDVMKITGATGIDNVIRNWHTSGIKSTLNWYQGISPNNFLIPNKSTWEKEQGINKNKEKLAY